MELVTHLCRPIRNDGSEQPNFAASAQFVSQAAQTTRRRSSHCSSTILSCPHTLSSSPISSPHHPSALPVMPAPKGASGEDIRPVRSILDSDLYKFTMQQAILYSPIEDPPVSYQFTNRSKNMTFTRRAFEQIQNEVKGLASLSLSAEERMWLEKNCPYFKKEYLDWLSAFRFAPQEQVLLRFSSLNEGSGNDEIGELEIEVKGIWSEVILYEVPLMSIVSETYFRTIDTKWDMQGQRGE